MRTWWRSGIGLVAVVSLALAGGCGEEEVTSPTTRDGPYEPPAVSAPASPSEVGVTVQENSVWVRWTPGDRTLTQEVVLSRVDGLEPDRINEIKSATQYNAVFAQLTWGASYRVVVAAVNEAGRSESAPASFEISIPEAPVLKWFSATQDPTCLAVEWTASGPAKGYRIELTGASEDASFEEAVSPSTETVFCASSYPIFDGMTYTARVIATFEGLELASETREFTVDFDPEYSLTGVWRGGSWVFEQYWDLTLDLVDAEGDISGSWTDWRSSGRVTGTRIGGGLELTFDGRGEYDGRLSGDLAGPGRIQGMVWPGLVYPVRLERD